MRKYLIPNEGKFYKANLHTHSTHSDGTLTPEKLKEVYAKNGYSIVAYTDHNVLNYFSELSDENFLVLCGYEADISTRVRTDSGMTYNKTCHMCAIARDPKTASLVKKPDEYTPDKANKLISDLNGAGFIVNYNHPYWSNEDSRDYLQLDGFAAMEIYNTGCELNVNNGNTLSDWACMLRNGKKLFAIATDDNHNRSYASPSPYEDDSCVGFTAIKSPSLTYADVITALDNGHFYASWGPEIKSLYIEDNKLCIETSPARAIFLRCNNIGSKTYDFSPNNDLTYAEFNLDHLGKDEVIWFEVVDGNKNIAVTNPYYS
jgi:DNA polymerase III, alpha subunit